MRQKGLPAYFRTRGVHMKRIRYLIFSVMILLLLSACGKTSTGQTAYADRTTQSASDGQTEKNVTSGSSKSGKVLIAYFSWAENAVQDNIDAMTSPSVSAPGNVSQLALWIQEETGGGLFSIRVTEPYPADWDGCLNRANKEKADDEHPALSETLGTIEEYDTIFLGYPNWWYSCPMAIYSFIDQHDLTGKQIYLFCSHGTGGLANSVKDITDALPNGAAVSDNVFHVYQNDTPSARGDVSDWLKELGY